MNSVSLCCPICGVSFSRNQSAYNRNIKNNQTPVCSRTCSNKLSYRTRLKPKGVCLDCGNPCKLETRKKICRCFSCKKAQKKKSKTFDNFDWSNIKLEDLQNESGICGSSGSIHSKIRSHSRWVYTKAGKPMVCKRCNYNIHVEICHIKPVKSFNKIETLGTVNDIDNIIALCRNCHWELDHGLWFLS